MTAENPMHLRKRTMTPLWVISLFLGLTETILGVGVIQTGGGVQIALASFVIVFPAVIAGVFFLILWFKPYVLYSPFEFDSAADAATYIEAISKAAKKIDDKVIEVETNVKEIEKIREELLAHVQALEEKIKYESILTLSQSMALNN
ncbi:hypothetical protein AB4P93_22730 [Pseudomonas sp. B26140]|uniref:hypothetical protein n=1 Tax=Pseudomonas sp. B26140 TaxID=3235112 RepID=UPI0037838E57